MRDLAPKDLNHFYDIYENGEMINPMPEDKKITVYCESETEEGYITDIFKAELGLAELIAKKWQYQEVVNDLTKTK